jgi:D-serine deaminase-like pyridoxal phosphate-dependent protein
MGDLERLRTATAHLDAPFALVDLQALRANAQDMVRRADGLPIRLASKSIRARAILDEVLATPGYAGVLAFTLPEALWLHGHGTRDLVVAYPTVDRGALRALASDPAAAAQITIMVDDVAQLDAVDREVPPASDARAQVRVALDLDTSWQPLRGRLRVGARRSPLRTPAQAAAFARAVAARPGFRLSGLMAYEAQIAGVGDAGGRGATSRARAAAVRVMQTASARELAPRRRAVVEAVRRVAELDFVNGGGTGSLERTARERGVVTEVAAGSGLYAPTLFDAYRAFTPRPAALFALPVVRAPGRGAVTALGGGYPASGAAGGDRLPVPYLPAGLELDRMEGTGEVQTPLLGAAAAQLRIGDVVFFRHAKAGELCERFDVLHLVEGDRVVDTVPTYRGEGKAFL